MRRMNLTLHGVLIMVALASIAGGCSSPQERHDRFLADGKQKLEKQDYARAALQFRNAMQLKPNDPETHYQLGLANLGLHNVSAAFVLFRQANQLNPAHIGAQLKLAEILSATDSRELLEDSEKRVKSVLSLVPDNTDALSILAVAEFKLGHADKAEESLREALRKAPAQIQFHAKLAGLALARGDRDGAEKLLKQATETAPKTAESWLSLGRFYVVTKRMPDAEAQFRKAVEVDPRSGAALLDLGRSQHESGKMDEAEKSFRLAAGLADKQYQPIHAIFLWQGGRKEAAVREFAELAKKDPTDRAARTRLVAVYLASRQESEALRVLAGALKENPNDADALLQRGEIYLSKQAITEAQADLMNVIHYRPEDAPAHYLISRVHQARNEHYLRRQELTEALRLDPSLLAVRIELADTFIGAPKSALDLIDAAPARQRRLLPAIVMRNWALLASGDLVAARKGIDEGLAIARASELLLQDGVLKLNQQHIKTGRLALEEVLSKEPDNLRALRMLARSYFSAKETAAGIAKVRVYASQRPHSAPLHGYLGEALLIAGDSAGARSAFLTSKTSDPAFQPAEVGLALLDSKEGKLDSARQTLRRLMNGTVPNSLAAVRLGMIEESSGNYPAAIAAFKKALETRTGDWVSLNDLAYCLILAGQRDEALKYAQQAKEIAPDNPFVNDTLGWAFYNKGMYESAVAQLEPLRNGPSAAHRYHLAMAYFKRGDAERGKQILDAAHSMDPTSAEAIMAQQIADEATR